LSSWNSSSTSSVQMKGLHFRRSLKIGRARSASLAINRLSAAKHLVSFCTSLMRAGGHTASIVMIFSGLASILRYETRKPRTLPVVTSNTHLSGFSLVRVRCNLSKTRARLSNRDTHDLTLKTMSSTYTSTKSLIRLPNVLCMARTKVGRAFLRP
jgi:hypothetical protein